MFKDVSHPEFYLSEKIVRYYILHLSKSKAFLITERPFFPPQKNYQSLQVIYTFVCNFKHPNIILTLHLRKQLSPTIESNGNSFKWQPSYWSTSLKKIFQAIKKAPFVYLQTKSSSNISNLQGDKRLIFKAYIQNLPFEGSLA